MTSLDYQPLQIGFMQQCGSSLLKALQNESMVPLDLLVRESVQNSLDAAEEGVGSVSVDFSIRELETDALAGLLSGPDIANRLRAQHPERSRILEVRDGNTTGLTGPLRLHELRPGEPHGNLLKLVYEVGRSQEREAAGGSWGFGKTVYFRVGVGLVFYYSRIRSKSGFEERLAACLIEDERSPGRLQPSSQNGIAWWGSDGGPVTDPETIRRVLEVLGARPFVREETGTAVLIPLLRSDLGPRQGDQDDDYRDRTDEPPPPWHRSDEEYLRVALQRWYCVRLDNQRFRAGPWLDARVNGARIRAAGMLPAFRVAQALYNRAIASAAPVADDWLAGMDGDDVRVAPVGPLLQTVEGSSTVGTLAIARLSAEQLGMGPPSNLPSPYWSFFGRTESPPWNPVVGFVRAPGMVVRWDDRSDKHGWSRGVSPLADRFLIALFVPDGSRELHPKLRSKLKQDCHTLEAFLRNCELADHHQWRDPASVTVIGRMRARTAEQLAAFSNPPRPTGPEAPVDLTPARILAKVLLPTGFGTDSSPPRPSEGAGGGSSMASRSAHAHLEIRGTQHGRSSVSVDFRIYWNRAKQVRPCALTLAVDSESSPIAFDSWTRDALGPFPLRIRKVSLHTGESGDGCHVGHELDQVGSQVLVLPPEGCTSIEGTLTIEISKVANAFFQPVLSLECSPNWERA